MSDDVLLLAPGPTPVPERTRRRMSEPLVHHRQPAFVELMKEARAGLQWLHATSSDTLILSCSGTGAMEAALINFASRGDKVIAVEGGKFGERWAKVARTYGLEVVSVAPQWGAAVTVEAIEDAFEHNPDARMLVLTVNETSTATVHPFAEIARAVRARAPEMLIVYDCITALGVYDIPFDALDLDVVACGSQKAFGLPPGMATLAVSERAWAAAERSDIPKFYFDLRRERDKQRQHQTAFTSPISLVVGLVDVLEMMREEGREGLFARHARVAAAVRAAVEALGLALYSQSPSNSLTGIVMPDGVDGQKLVKVLRDELGVAIAGGQGDIKGRVVRIGHLGFVGEREVLYGLSRFEKALERLGHPVEQGVAVAAAAKLL